tara:strand:- start:7248 stop:7601 length:354 start_codon:yes stop_codon:yes gene_type:complete
MKNHLFNMKLNIQNIQGDLVKQDDRYIVKDNTRLRDLTLSSTRLKANKQTTGHSHEGQEEIYFFVQGQGKMKLDNETIDVKSNDVVLIEDNVFHKVINDSQDDLYFVCVFNKKRATT